MVLEILGILAGAISIAGVVLNNRRMRSCFLLWFVSNLLSAVLHGAVGLWSLAARDLVFLLLAVEGWRLWNKANNTPPKTPE